MNRPTGQQFYGLNFLNRFATFGRGNFLAMFGHPAPPEDPSRPIKTWLDQDAEGHESVTYDILTSVNPPVYGQLTLSGAEAATVNLPDDGNHPAYVPLTTTPATAPGAPTINPAELSSEADAKMLAGMLGGVYAESQEGGISWNGETRRRWFIGIGDQQYLAADLLMEMYAPHGVGAPGKWDTTGAPKWIPAPPRDPSVQPVSMPVYQLLPNEEFVLNIGGMGYRIHNKNADPALTIAAGTGGGLTDQQAQQLRLTYLIAQKLAEQNGIDVGKL